MENAEALRIVEAFANGVDPETGLTITLPKNYQEAFILAAQALQRVQRSDERRQTLPGNTGQPWRADEEACLVASFDTGSDIAQLARLHKRTEGAIRSRLFKLGKIDDDRQFAGIRSSEAGKGSSPFRENQAQDREIGS